MGLQNKFAFLYVFAYAVLVFFLGVGLTLTWDEGAHAVSGIFIRDLIVDFVRAIPASFSNSWVHDYGYSFFSNYFAVLSSGFNYPPAYALIASMFYLVFGVHELAARLLSAAFTALALLFVYLLGKRLYGESTAFVSMAALSVTPLFFRLSLSILRDVPLLFFFLAALYYLLRSLEAGQAPAIQRDSMKAAILLVAGTLTKYSMLILYPILAVFLLLAKKGTDFVHSARFKFLAVGATTLLLYFLLYFAFALQFPAGSTERETLVANVITWFSPGSERLAPAYSAGRSALGAVMYYPLAALEVFGPLVFALGLFGLARAAKYRNARDRLALSVIGLHYLVFTLIQNKEPRFVLPLLVFFAFLAADATHVLAQRLKATTQQRLFYALVVFSVALPLGFAPGGETLPDYLHIHSQADLDAVASYAAESLEPNAAFVFASHDNRVNWVNFSFYLLKYDRGHSRRVIEFSPAEFERRVKELKEKGLPVYILAYSGDRGKLWEQAQALPGLALKKSFEQVDSQTIEIHGVR